MPLPTLLTTTVANACSSDGSVIVGSAPSGGGTVACWWDKATQTLTLLTQPVGETFTEAYDCSSDGSVIVGANGGSNAFWWDKTTGTPTTLSVGSGHNAQALGCSSDGSIIVGYYINFTTGQTAVWWNKSTNILTELNNLSSISTNGSLARGVSADGAVAVGISLDDSGNERAVWWNRSTGVVTLMPWPGGIQPFLNGMGPYGASLDGSIIVGSGEDSLGNVVACWWNKTTGTPTLLGQLPGNNGGRALAVSDDGTRISGWANDSSFNQWAVWWDKASGDIVKLDFDPSADNSVSDGGIGISADGNFVVGDNYINPGDVQTAVFWDISPPPPPDLLLQGRIFAAARAKGQRNLVTAIRARIRANSGLKGLLNWPDYSLSLQAKVTSGARALGALVPGNTVLAARIRANANLRQLLSGVTNIPVFPTLPVGFPVVVKPTFANISGSIPSGRSMRTPQQTLPIWEFELNFESLRDQTQNSQPFLPLAGFTDFTKLSQVFIANIGQYGKFLFDAWWDDSRLDQPIALGDGTSTRFLMVRTWGYGLIQFTEPVGSVNTITNVKINGTVQDPSTYFITSNNVLVFRSAPANGVTITSTFSYYYLCQFSEDMQDYSEFMKNRWTAKIKFRSVEGATPFTTSAPVVFPSPVPPPAPPSPPTFIFTPSFAYAASASGSIVWGQYSPNITGGGSAGFWLTALYLPTVMQDRGNGSTALACSSDGSLGFGWDLLASQDWHNAVYWTGATGVEVFLQNTLIHVGPVNGPFTLVPGPSEARCCSADGSIAGGFVSGEFGPGPTGHFEWDVPVWWDVKSNMFTSLNFLVGPTFSSGTLTSSEFAHANGCSSDGSVLVGDDLRITSFSFLISHGACWWNRITGAITILGYLPGTGPTFNQSSTMAAYDCSSDGSIIVGTMPDSSSKQQAVWWDNITGVATVLTPPVAFSSANAIAVSDDGNTIIGSCNPTAPNPDILVPIVWDRQSGVGQLISRHIPNPGEPTGVNRSFTVTGCSADGSLATMGYRHTAPETDLAVWFATGT